MLAYAAASSPSGMTVTQPTMQTVTAYSPAVIMANPVATASLVAAYFSPMQAAAGVVVPGGAVTRTYTVTFFSDGSSRSVTQFCAAGVLPEPPVMASTNSGSSSNSR